MRHFLKRLINVVKVTVLDEGIVFTDDVSKIRNEAPKQHIILDADDPREVSPGVYMFWGHYIGGQRMMRYNCTVLGDRILIEPVL